MSIKGLVEQLEAKIQSAYTTGTTIEEAEKLATEFLGAQLQISAVLKTADLDARLRKSGTKSIRAAIYLDIVQKNEKKPTEAQISAMLDSDNIVASEQAALDTAEVVRSELERVYDVFLNAHIFFRGVSRGRFD
jgi:hypothetical protein